MATWLEGCTRQDFGTSGGSWTRQPAIIVLHSTETGDHGWPGYSGGSSAPHFTHDPLTGDTRQHVSLAEAARALVNASGGVETNRGGAVQIELIGTCDPARRGDKGWTYLPDFEAWGPLSALLEQISSACGIPLTESVSWPAYPGSYGTGAPQRLSGSAWKSYKGVLGHMHVPENSHGDPGNVDIAAILEGADMPTAEEIAREVWRYDQDGAKSQAWAYLQDGTAYKVWSYDQNGAARQAWGYQKDMEQVTDAIDAATSRAGRHRAPRDAVVVLLAVLAVLSVVLSAVSLTWQATSGG